MATTPNRRELDFDPVEARIERPTHLLAVVADEPAAERLEQALATPGVGSTPGVGVPVTRSARRHVVDSITSEMREETREGFIVPTAGVAVTKEMAKGLRITVPLAAAIGALVLLPLSLIPWNDTHWWQRALLAAAIGSLSGATIGTIVGASLAVKGPNEPLAAERGVVLRIDSTDDQVIDLVRAEQPLRIDLVAEDGVTVRTLATEDSVDPETSAARMREQLTQPPGGRWGDEVTGARPVADPAAAAARHDDPAGSRIDLTNPKPTEEP